jgi:hypothetical protein
MIEKLTKSQINELEAFKNKWLRVGLSTERIDKNFAIELCHKIQTKLLNRKKTPVVVLDSPWQCWIAVCMFANGKNYAPVSAQVRDQVSAQVRAQVSAQVSAQWQYPNFWGGQDGWWWGLSYYETMRDLGVAEAQRLNPWFAASRVVGWCWMYWDVVIMSDRPRIISRDDRNRLHCAIGPAVAYDDGTEVWAWHGVRVPSRLIERPTSYTANEYRELPAEQRRALGEHSGWSHILQLLGSSTVDTTIVDGLAYDLVRCGDGSQYLKMQSPELQDGSQPFYLEPVHEGLKTAAGARKWRVARNPNGRWWGPEECDKDPSLSLGQHT